MTKTEAMQNALGTVCVAEIDNDINRYMFSCMDDYYSLTLFTYSDKSTAERVLKKLRHGFVDGTSVEIIGSDSAYHVYIVWRWQ